MAVAHVQSTGAQSVGSVASLVKAFTSSVTAGNAIAVGGVANTNSLGTNAVSDTLSNSYTRGLLNNAVAAGRGETAVYYALNVTGGACTVTIDPAGSDFVCLGISEFSGVATASAADGTGTASANSGTYTVSSYTPTDDGVAVGVATQNEGGTTFTESNSLAYENENATNAMPISWQYKLTTGPGNPNLSWTLGSTRQGCAAGMSLKQAAAAALITPSLVHGRSVNRAAFW